MPALGIVAAVLGVIKAMGSLDQSPELLGGLIGSALVGTFGGILLSYGFTSPLAHKIKATREKQLRVLFHRQADLARLHERGDAANRPGARPQDDFVE